MPSPSSTLKPTLSLSDSESSSTKACTPTKYHRLTLSPPTEAKTRRKIDIVDTKIVKACNELIQEQTNSARLRAEQQTEYRIAYQKYQQIHQKWLESCKIPSSSTSNTSSMTKVNISSSASSSSSILGGNNFSIHQEAVKSVFREEEEDTDDDGGTESKNNHNMSPYLLTRLSNLCCHVHLMTLLETYAKTTIHEEYRVNIIWWIHEYWEQLEKETTDLNVQKKQAMADLKNIQQKQQTKLVLLDIEYQQNKKDFAEKTIRRLRGDALEEEQPDC